MPSYEEIHEELGFFEEHYMTHLTSMYLTLPQGLRFQYMDYLTRRYNEENPQKALMIEAFLLAERLGLK